MGRRHKNKTLAITSVLLITVLGCLLLGISLKLLDLDKDGAGIVALICAMEIFVFNIVFTFWYFLIRHRRRH
jgi:hypothetical protein